jgi:hypothetical protein
VVATIGDRVEGRRMDLAAGASVQVNSGAHRCAYGELVRYTDEAGIAYVRIALGPTQSAILVVRADTITPARVPTRASEMR